MGLCDGNYVIPQKNRARCTLNKDSTMRKVFLECAVVELVYNFDQKSTVSLSKGESTAKVSFKLFWGSYKYIYIYIYTVYLLPARASEQGNVIGSVRIYIYILYI